MSQSSPNRGIKCFAISYRMFLHGVSGGMIVGFGIGLLVSAVTIGVGNNIPIPVGTRLITIFSLIVGVSLVAYDAHKAVSK